MGKIHIVHTLNTCPQTSESRESVKRIPQGGYYCVCMVGWGMVAGCGECGEWRGECGGVGECGEWRVWRVEGVEGVEGLEGVEGVQGVEGMESVEDVEHV